LITLTNTKATSLTAVEIEAGIPAQVAGFGSAIATGRRRPCVGDQFYHHVLAPGNESSGPSGRSHREVA